MQLVRDRKQGHVQSVTLSVSPTTLPASFFDFILIVKLDATLRVVCIIVQHSESCWLVFATLRVMRIKLDATLSVVFIKPNATLQTYMSEYIHAYTYIHTHIQHAHMLRVVCITSLTACMSHSGIHQAICNSHSHVHYFPTNMPYHVCRDMLWGGFG